MTTSTISLSFHFVVEEVRILPVHFKAPRRTDATASLLVFGPRIDDGLWDGTRQ